MTNQEMKDYLMKHHGGSMNTQILGMFIELKGEIQKLKGAKCSCKDTKPSTKKR